MKTIQNIKANYNEIMKETIKGLTYKPKLLLHACCGPCTTYPLTLLNNYFDIDIIYLNHNIFPYEEWNKRLETLKYFINEFNKKNNASINLFVIDYDHNIYLKECEPFANDLEGGKRCELCHNLRLSLSYKFAAEHNYDFFTTVMTVSSHKPSSLLNELGKKLNQKYPNTTYLLSDFKKEEGQLKGIKISKEYNLYRQNYCGCEFAFNKDNSK